MNNAAQQALSLVVRLPLMGGESLASLVQRHCDENFISSIGEFLRLVETISGLRTREVTDLAREPESLRAVEALTGLAVGALSHLQITALRGAAPGRDEIRLRQGAHEWSQKVRSSKVQLLCPACIREAAHAKAAWEFAQAPVCTLHSLALIDVCPACDVKLRFNRTGLATCPTCAHDLSSSGKATRREVDAPTVSAAMLVQRPAMVAFGSGQYTAPIDANELSLLLRLCAFPALGEDVDSGLTGRIANLSIQRRIEALTRLGSAMVRDRIDSAKLLDILLGRWPYAMRLPVRDRFDLLERACATLELPREVFLLLCHGHDHEPLPTAAKLFEGRPPQLKNPTELATFLEVDKKVMREICSLEHVSLNPSRGFGYDMDDVLRMKNSLASICSFEEADAMLGHCGLATELVKLKLLSPMPDRSQRPGIRPADVAALLARIHRSIESPAVVRTEVVPLHWCKQLGFDSGQIAWCIAQILGGSLRVVEWGSPFGIMSLMVCKDRLARLAEWPDKAVAQCQFASDFERPRPRSTSP